MISEKQVLEKILLPMNVEWEVSSIETDERNEWRHPDLWQYKTFQHHYPVTKRKDHDYVSILSEESKRKFS